jgi:hypothetical protein
LVAGRISWPEVTLVKHPESKGLVAGLVLVVGCAALRADPAEDRGVQAVMKWGGRITREEAAEGKPVVGVDLEPVK